MAKKRPEELVTAARRMRKEPTWAEKRLWEELRRKNVAGLKFRRQHPVIGFVADFCCVAAKVVVELDGEGHEGREARDSARDAQFAGQGWLTLRYPNQHVFQDVDSVVEDIYRHCLARLPSP
ncbi:MAG: endonuclease domain-containing protein [Fimbriimonadaceae bacterium]|nr:endonuclease domain-containing protein [Fimbriimonadaceae bacterium]QYK56245.1 MAG: endonuclease domain-containing protein [Fimbriimonadaceae bacterium]